MGKVVNKWREERLKRWRRHPYCCYCGCFTLFPHTGNSNNEPETATWEHVYPKYDIRRFAKNAHMKLKIACLKCNQSKAQKELTKMYGDYWLEYNSFNLIEFVTQEQFQLNETATN